MKKKKKELDTTRILFVPDIHTPVQHKDAFKFLAYLKNQLKPTLVIAIGDLLDNQALSFFEKNPNLPGALDELILAKRSMKELYKLFPDLLIVKGNHDYRPERLASKAGLPSEYLKTMPTLLNSPEGWEYKNDLHLTLPDGNHLYVAHDVGRSLKKAVAARAMCVVGGHYHSKFKITYFSNHYSLNWGMNVGCLIDQDSPAFDYMRNSSKILTGDRFILGTGVILDGAPALIPMYIQNDRWVQKVTELHIKRLK